MTGRSSPRPGPARGGRRTRRVAVTAHGAAPGGRYAVGLPAALALIVGTGLFAGVLAVVGGLLAVLGADELLSAHGSTALAPSTA